LFCNLDIQAGKTHERAAEVREKNLKELTDAADSYVEASDAYRRDDPEAAIRCRERAFALIQQSTSESKQTRMSRVKEILGQIYEHDLKDLKRAREAYKEAAERLPKARELCVVLLMPPLPPSRCRKQDKHVITLFV
jgi:alpha-soluble NSF attachment protein